jgi:hypothetical protein
MEFLSGLPARDRTQLLEVMQEIADHLVVKSDEIRQTDTSGRPHWLRFSGGFAVSFWVDHAGKEVRVTDVGLE